MPELSLESVRSGADAAGDSFTVEAVLRNAGTGSGRVRVRAIGEAPVGGAPPHADAVIEFAPGSAPELRIGCGFKPVRLVVDPEVELLFLGRKRCEEEL